MTTDVAIVSGMTAGRVIGRGNELPWHISDDLKNFKRLTTGGTVIMGLNTYRSIGKALPKRTNIVLSQEPIELTDAQVAHSLEDAFAQAEAIGAPTYIIGGASVYEQALPLVSTMHLSLIKKDYDGDVLFPTYDEDQWEQTESTEFDEFTFVTLKRKQS